MGRRQSVGADHVEITMPATQEQLDRLAKVKDLACSPTTQKTTGNLRDQHGAMCWLGCACQVYMQETGDGEWKVQINLVDRTMYVFRSEKNYNGLRVVETWLGIEPEGLLHDAIISRNDDSDEPLCSISDFVLEYAHSEQWDNQREPEFDYDATILDDN